MDASVIRLVVLILGVVGVLAVGFIGFIATQQREPPASLVLLAGNAIGALVGILVSPHQPPKQGRGER